MNYIVTFINTQCLDVPVEMVAIITVRKSWLTTLYAILPTNPIRQTEDLHFRKSCWIFHEHLNETTLSSALFKERGI